MRPERHLQSLLLFYTVDIKSNRTNVRKGENYLFVCNGKNADFPVMIAVYAEPGGEVKVDTKEPGQIFEQFNLK